MKRLIAMLLLLLTTPALAETYTIRSQEELDAALSSYTPAVENTFAFESGTYRIGHRTMHSRFGGKPQHFSESDGHEAVLHLYDVGLQLHASGSITGLEITDPTYGAGRGSRVVVSFLGDSPKVRNCEIHDLSGGVHFYQGAGGLIEDSAIYNTGWWEGQINRGHSIYLQCNDPTRPHTVRSTAVWGQVGGLNEQAIHCYTGDDSAPQQAFVFDSVLVGGNESLWGGDVPIDVILTKVVSDGPLLLGHNPGVTGNEAGLADCIYLEMTWRPADQYGVYRRGQFAEYANQNHRFVTDVTDGTVINAGPWQARFPAEDGGLYVGDHFSIHRAESTPDPIPDLQPIYDALERIEQRLDAIQKRLDEATVELEL